MSLLNKIHFEMNLLDLKMNKYKPAFETENIAICLSCDEIYFSYCVVTIQSIIEYSTVQFNYDILILHSNLSESLQNKLLEQVCYQNISIRFVNIEEVKSSFLVTFTESSYITIATYYRLFMPVIFSSYKKMIYLDCDLVLNKDISELFNLELSSQYLIGAVPDVGILIDTLRNTNIRYHVSDILGIANPEYYVNAGVLLFNLKQMNKEDTISKFFDTLQDSNYKSMPLNDQDIINKVCLNRINFIDNRWNVLSNISFNDKKWHDLLPSKNVKNFLLALDDPYIIHYAGANKPWKDPSVQLASYFWSSARKSFIYEEIIYKNCITPELAFILLNYKQIKRKYNFYRILETLSFGKNKYKRKQKELLVKINLIKSLFKNMKI